MLILNETMNQRLDDIIVEENLKPELARAFMGRAFRRGILRYQGTEFAAIIPPISFFRADKARTIKKQAVFEKLRVLFVDYLGANGEVQCFEHLKEAL